MKTGRLTARRPPLASGVFSIKNKREKFGYFIEPRARARYMRKTRSPKEPKKIFSTCRCLSRVRYSTVIESGTAGGSKLYRRKS